MVDHDDVASLGWYPERGERRIGDVYCANVGGKLSRYGAVYDGGCKRGIEDQSLCASPMEEFVDNIGAG